MITPEHISLTRTISAEDHFGNLPMHGTLENATKKAVAIAETERITRALKETKGNKSRAAELLQVSYKTLLNKIKDYNISF